MLEDKTEEYIKNGIKQLVCFDYAHSLFSSFCILCQRMYIYFGYQIDRFVGCNGLNKKQVVKITYSKEPAGSFITYQCFKKRQIHYSLGSFYFSCNLVDWYESRSFFLSFVIAYNCNKRSNLVLKEKHVRANYMSFPKCFLMEIRVIRKDIQQFKTKQKNI